MPEQDAWAIAETLQAVASALLVLTERLERLERAVNRLALQPCPDCAGVGGTYYTPSPTTRIYTHVCRRCGGTGTISE